MKYIDNRIIAAGLTVQYSDDEGDTFQSAVINNSSITEEIRGVAVDEQTGAVVLTKAQGEILISLDRGLTYNAIQVGVRSYAPLSLGGGAWLVTSTAGEIIYSPDNFESVEMVPVTIPMLGSSAWTIAQSGENIIMGGDNGYASITPPLSA
ncbi:MAG: hypothetical protein DRQ46_10830 [Gammaproteobacteria bacterium]|nr:MAG: hypothetical protein DRQ46_10830 [Gammaproteobacteria bacterium]